MTEPEDPDARTPRRSRTSFLHRRSESLARYNAVQAAVLGPALALLAAVYLVGCLLGGTDPTVAVVLLVLGVAASVLALVQVRGLRRRAAQRASGALPPDPERAEAERPMTARESLVAGIVVVPASWVVAAILLAVSGGSDGSAIVLALGGTAIGVSLIIRSLVLRARAR